MVVLAGVLFVSLLLVCVTGEGRKIVVVLVVVVACCVPTAISCC